jgi:hypothetical protein
MASHEAAIIMAAAEDNDIVYASIVVEGMANDVFSQVDGYAEDVVVASVVDLAVGDGLGSVMAGGAAAEECTASASPAVDQTSCICPSGHPLVPCTVPFPDDPEYTLSFSGVCIKCEKALSPCSIAHRCSTCKCAVCSECTSHWAFESFCKLHEYTFSDKSTYVGEATNPPGWYPGAPVSVSVPPAPHGFGKKTWPRGNTYKGQFCYDEFQGVGVYTYPSGAYYAGDFVKGKWHGRGIHVTSYGQTYVGEHEFGMRHGRGVLTESNGRVHDGVFKKDCFQIAFKVSGMDVK